MALCCAELLHEGQMWKLCCTKGQQQIGGQGIYARDVVVAFGAQECQGQVLKRNPCFCLAARRLGGSGRGRLVAFMLLLLLLLLLL
jgi:hypothetical protein